MVRSVSEWLPDRPPKRREVLVTVVVSFSMAVDLFPFDAISWGWVAVGFVVTGIAVGPAGTTAVGKRFGQWFRNIGVTGRAAVIVLFAAVAWGTLLTVEIPITLIDSFVVGMWAALVLYLLAHLVQSREIDGWRTG